METTHGQRNVPFTIIDWGRPSQLMVLTGRIRYFCTTSPSRKYLAITLFVLLSILIGSLTVCLTARKLNFICEHIHRRTITDIKKYNSLPQSVAIDHFNNDSLLDFIIANTGLDGVDIFLGLNNRSFEHHMTYSTGSYSKPCSVAVGNLDDHHGIDIVVANFGINSIVIFMGMGDGNFTFNQSLSTGSSRPLLIALADVINDHRLDIAVLNYGTNDVGIFLAFGDGSFELLIIYPTGYDSLPNSFVIADLNSDDYSDIIVANFGTNTIGLFFGNENGTFGEQKIYSTGVGSNPSSVAVGDIDHDQYLDIIVANAGVKNISIFFGDRTGNFIKYVTYSTGSNSYPEFVAVYDFNGDNQLDIIAIDSANEKIYVFPGNENGTFPLLSIYLTDYGSNPVWMSGADFNGDNRSDALIVNRGAGNVLLLMDYDLNISANYSTFTEENLAYPSSIATADLNGDHFLDIIVTNAGNNLICIFFGYGNGRFILNSSIPTGIDSAVDNAKLVDFNNDHQLDLVVLNPDNDSFSILFGKSDGTFSIVTTYPTITIIYPNLLTVGDVNNDHCLDIIILGYFSASIEIHAGDCNRTFEMISMFEVEPDSRPYRVAIADFNDDTRMDLVLTYVEYNSISFYFGDGTGRFSTSPMDLAKDSRSWNDVVSGDFNNDHRLDLVASVSTTNEIVIFFGNGNGSFTSGQIYPVTSCYDINSIVVDHFNSDHHLDLALCCTNTDTIAILFGNGHGEFRSQATYSTQERSHPRSLVSGDFNNDNKLDIAIVDTLGDRIGIFISYYKADFASQAKYTIHFSPKPYSVAIGDLNHDNLSDMIVVDSGTKNVAVGLGFGNGTFGNERRYSIGPTSFPQHVNVGDLNGDGHVDAVVADSKNNRIIIYLGNGHGTFQSNLTYAMGLQSSPVWVAIANLNNDQWTDLVVANQGTDSLAILYGYDYATFVLHQTYSTGHGSFPRTVSVGDINNDNQLDIIVANYVSSTIEIFLGDGNGSFPSQIIYFLGIRSMPRSMAVADINKDGYLDVITGDEGTRSISVLLGNGNGTFERVITRSIGSSFFPSAIIVHDINNDDQLDVIVADDLGDNVRVFLGLGNDSLLLVARYSTGFGSNPNSVAVGDLNNDHYPDIVVAHTDTGSIGVLYGYGNGNYTSQLTYPLRKFSRPSSVALHDFTNDGHLDIVVADSFYNFVQIFIGFGNGSFSKSKEYAIGFAALPFYLIVNYFNDDNLVDIAVICSGYSAFIILFGTEDGSFLLGKAYSTSSGSLIKTMASGDFNNDSHVDLVITNIDDNTMDVFLHDGNEPFAMPITLSTGFGSKPQSLAIGDFDHDNRSDIVVANYGTDNIAIILSIKMDTFTNPMTYSTKVDSRPHGVVLGYFNDDTKLDIAVINSGSDDVMIFQGYGDGSFRAIGFYPTGIGSAPRSIIAADFNNDHRMDLAIANAGANNVLILFGLGNGTFGKERSYSMIYDSRPYSIAVGDFDRDGWMDMAVANFGADYVEILLQPC